MGLELLVNCDPDPDPEPEIIRAPQKYVLEPWQTGTNYATGLWQARRSWSCMCVKAVAQPDNMGTQFMCINRG
eukprot:scaffold141063_cov19-Tisochrysis_lutea.AAC.2